MSSKFSNMRVVKQKTSNFTIVDNRLIKDNNLSLKARGLLIFMLQLPDDWEFSEVGLSKITGEGHKSIRSGLKELIEQKYLYRSQNKSSGGKFGSSIYYLFEEPTELFVEGEEEVLETENSTFTIDKNHPDYDYFHNGGWINEL